jgi:hypothetical protein
MLSDVLSRLVETIAEQGEDMQGYVTELILTLEAVVEALDSDIRPMDGLSSRDIFKSTPNLVKEASSPVGGGGGGGQQGQHSQGRGIHQIVDGIWGGFIKSKHRVKERFDTGLKKLSTK